jgi:hypothetical protein
MVRSSRNAEANIQGGTANSEMIFGLFVRDEWRQTAFTHIEFRLIFQRKNIMLRGLILALVASVALSSSAFAGGGNGGTKKDATIKTVNDLHFKVATVIDASDSLKAKLAAGTATLDDLNAAGGKIIDPGKYASFKVRAGSHRIGFASVSDSGLIGNPFEVTRTVGKGKTLTYNLSSLTGS